MRNELLSVIIASIILTSPVLVYAQEDIPEINAVEIPVSNYSNYSQSQYPLPVNQYQTQGWQDNQLSGNVVLVPASTTFAASLITPLSSETASVGDSVSFYLNSDFYYGQNLIAPAGSRVNGTVILAKRGGYAGKNGKLQVRFSNITTPTGQMIPITASIQTEDGTGILKAGTAKDVTGEYVKNLGIGAAAGAVLGTAMGALSSGSVGKGAVYGTAVGGGLGLGRALIERGDNVEIPQNAQMNIILDQPVTVSSNTPY
ncbi:MAG: hypothetical protein LUG16_08720 [Candidatus Gastranaerophilales bacterium]|nr:hypothetical protein [Candidatus Gastranaerophilales bacterium]